MSELQAALSEIEELKQKLVQMEELIAWFKKQLFGSGKSETRDALHSQLELKLLDLQKQHEELEQKKQLISYERGKAKARQSRDERFKDLPVKESVVLEPEEVLRHPELYERIGEEVTYEVDITNPQLFKRAIIRPKYRHCIDRTRPPVIAPAPKRAIEGSYASAGLITWVLLSKYLDHLPLARQQRMLKRWGAEIARQTLCDWVEAASFLLEVIYWKIKEGLLGGGYVQADETPIRFIDPDRKKGKTSKGHYWLMGKPMGNVFYEWIVERTKGAAKQLLDGFEGVLQTDGLASYNAIHGEGTGVVRVACWAHCRRKFTEAMGSDAKAASFILRLIGNLYHLDNEWQRQDITDPAQRAHLRQRDFAPTLSLLHKATVLLRNRARPTTNLAKACNYLLGQWDDLMTINRHGHVQLDNNLIEQAVRPTKLGLKNYLFVGHPDAGKRSAIIYTIIVCAQRWGINPEAYIKDLLTKLPTMSNQDDFTPLMPENWKPPVVVETFNRDDVIEVDNVTIEV